MRQRTLPFYDDIVHAEASTYAHQTEFYQSAIVTVDSPIQPAVLDNMGLPAAGTIKKLTRRHGRRQLQSEVEAIASSCFAQILAE